MFHQPFKGRLDPEPFRAFRRVEHHGLVVVVRRLERLLKKPVLNRGKRDFPFHWTLLPLHFQPPGQRGQLGDRRMTEQVSSSQTVTVVHAVGRRFGSP